MIPIKELRDDMDCPDNFNTYKNLVDKLTEQIAFLVPGIEKREFRKIDLDHKIPIDYGFKNGLHPLRIACLSNLQLITHTENRDKNRTLIFNPSILDSHDQIQAKLQDG